MPLVSESIHFTMERIMKPTIYAPYLSLGIAGELAISAKTVSTYRTRILEKMAVATNADSVRYAARYGLIA